jgi:hypothetical protein
MGMRMMLRLVSLVALSLGLGGCGVTAVIGAAASVVGAGVDIAGSAVSGTIDVVSSGVSGVSGAIDLATSDDDNDDNDKKTGKEDAAAKQILTGAKPEPSPENVETVKVPNPASEDELVDTVWESGD